MKRFTIYDAMEAAGVFSSNPANVQAVDKITGASIYVKAEYPKMFYHPKGEEQVLLAGAVDPATGRVEGKCSAIIHQLANNEEEANALLAAGWHRRAADAVAVRTGVPAPQRPAAKISKLEAELEELKRQHAALLAQRAQEEVAAPLAPVDSITSIIDEAGLKAQGLL